MTIASRAGTAERLDAGQIHRSRQRRGISAICGLSAVLVATTWTLQAAEPAPIPWSAIPENTNVLAVIQVDQIYSSPLAVKEGWRKLATQAFIQRDAVVPPGSRRMVLAGESFLDRELRPHQEIAIIEFAESASIQRLADLGYGEVSQLDQTPILQLGSDSYLGQRTSTEWVFQSPSTRPVFRRWLQQLAQPREQSHAAFLVEAAKRYAASQIMIALDLDGVWSKSQLEEFLASVPGGKTDSPSANYDLIETLQQLRGVAIAIDLSDAIHAKLTFSFSGSIGKLQPIARPMLSELLSRMGASAEFLDAWQQSASGNEITFDGSMTKGGVRRLLAVFRTNDLATDTAAASTTTNEENPAAAATLKFVKSMENVLDDVREALRFKKDNHALWVENAARKIDRLPVLNVDEAVLEYAQRVSNSLRYQGQAFRNANVRSGVRVQQSGANQTYVVNQGAMVSPYGAVWQTQRVQGADGTAIRMEERASARDVQFSEWRQIEDGLVEVRRAMTQKYQTEF